MIKEILVAFGLYQGLSSGTGSVKVGQIAVPEHSYVFGGSFLLRYPGPSAFASYGPFSTHIGSCESEETLCVEGNYFAFAAPRLCNFNGSQLKAGKSLVFSRIGSVSYKPSATGKARAVDLWYSEQRPRSITGISKEDGVVLIIIDAGEPLDGLARKLTKAGQSALQTAFDSSAGSILPLRSGRSLFKCS